VSDFRPRYVPRLAACAGILGLAILGGGLLYGKYQANRQYIAETLEVHDRLASIAAYESVIDKQPDTIAATLLDDLYLGDGQPAVLSANLLTLLEQLAANQGIAVNRESALPPRKQGPVTRIAGAMAISGTLPAIYGFLEQIEAARPVLFIDRLDIRVNQTGVPEEQSDTIASVEIEVSGLVRPKPGTEGGGGS
jgi:hypothetical protein